MNREAGNASRAVRVVRSRSAYEELSKAGDPLVKLDEVVDFELFRGEIERALAFSDGSKGGRPPWDALLMFKAFVLQALYGLVG